MGGTRRIGSMVGLGRMEGMGGTWETWRHGRVVGDLESWEERRRLFGIGGTWETRRHGRDVVVLEAWEGPGKLDGMGGTW